MEKSNWKFFLKYVLISFIIYILFFPTFVNNIFYKFIFTEYFTGETLLQQLAFLNWKLPLYDLRLSLSMSGCYLVAVIALYSQFGGSKHNAGTEHGSAKFLTDKEFDALIPYYNMRKDEYDHKRFDTEDTKMNYVKSVGNNIFEEFDFVANSKINSSSEDEIVLENPNEEVIRPIPSTKTEEIETNEYTKSQDFYEEEISEETFDDTFGDKTIEKEFSNLIEGYDISELLNNSLMGDFKDE